MHDIIFVLSPLDISSKLGKCTTGTAEVPVIVLVETKKYGYSF